MTQDLISLQTSQQQFFKTQATKNISFRKTALKKLRSEIITKEEAICKALYNDFKKPKFESVLTETGIVLMELDLAIKKIETWSKPKNVTPSLLNFPSTDKIYYDPYGVCLIIAPWNYPFQLAISALIGAIAAGNTAVIKPSELTPHTSKIISEIISAVFDDEYIAVVQGGVKTSQELLSMRWDYIFFTGSVGVGKIVAQAAAKHLTPVTLELGGKNPCIIDATANIALAAKRIVWGKFINGGQTCIAPDYILIDATKKKAFVKAIQAEIKKAYGENPKTSPDYPRIVNERNFERLLKMLLGENILLGGKTDKTDLYIEPTLVNEPNLDSEVMKDEIFGPILPIISFKDANEIDAVITKYEKPLSLYVFSKNSTFIKKIIATYSFGGGAVNDTVIQFGNHRLPFGGVGHSGIGAYHGKASFLTFSHKKAIVKKGNWLDIPVRYAPYKGKLKSIRFFFKYFK